MPPETDNLKVLELFTADQSDREKPYTSEGEIAALKRRDSQRRESAYDSISRGEVNTQNDLYRVAVILLHGDLPKDFITAHRLATIAGLLGHRSARWLAAASLDRLMMSLGMPQTYGTQFEYNEEERRYQLRLPVDDSTLLHFEKMFFDVPSVSDRLLQLNNKIPNELKKNHTP